MKIVLVTPAPAAETSGNSVTANRWQNILRTLGHQVSITTEWSDEHCDALIALHARRSHSSVYSYRKPPPPRPLIVALAGTDLYSYLPDTSEALLPLSIATQVVVLQSPALDQPDDITRAKTRIIYQSAFPPA